MRVSEKSSSFDRFLWSICDKPDLCHMTGSWPTEHCSCTEETGCTYLGRKGAPQPQPREETP